MTEDTPDAATETTATPPVEQSEGELQWVKTLQERFDEVNRLLRTMEGFTEDLLVKMEKLQVASGKVPQTVSAEEAIDAVQERVAVLAEKEKKNQAMLQKLAFTDKLTGLNNYAGFQNIANEAIARKTQELANARSPETNARRQADQVEKQPKTLSFIMLDIDHFKEINTKYGHEDANTVLIRVGLAINANIRNGTAARWGGDEFVVIVESSDPDSPRFIAERIRTAVAATTIEFESTRVPLTASLGVATWREGDTVKDIVKRADAALYEAKDEGRNRVVEDHSGSGNDIKSGSPE